MQKTNYNSALLLDTSLLDYYLRLDSYEGIGKIKKILLYNKDGFILSTKGDLWRIDLGSLFAILNQKKLVRFFETPQVVQVKKELTEITISDIVCNENIFLILSNQGTVYSCGTDLTQSGILGLGRDVMAANTPTIIRSLTRITQVSLSSKHAAAVDDKGNLYTWGTGIYGELCHPIATALHSPYLVEWSGRTFCNRVICHKNLTCVITDGKSDIAIYGSFNGNEIDKEDLSMKSRQIQNLPKSQIVDISFGDNFGVLLTDKGELYVMSEHFICQKLHFSLYFKSATVNKNKIYGITADGKYLIEWLYKLDLSKKHRRYDTFIRNETLSLVKVSELLQGFSSKLSMQPYQQLGGTVFFFSQEEDFLSPRLKDTASNFREGKIKMQVLKTIGKKNSKPTIDLAGFEYVHTATADFSDLTMRTGKTVDKSTTLKDKFLTMNFESKKENQSMNWKAITAMVSPLQKRKDALDMLGLSENKKNKEIGSQGRERRVNSISRLSQIRSMVGEQRDQRDQREQRVLAERQFNFDYAGNASVKEKKDLYAGKRSHADDSEKRTSPFLISDDFTPLTTHEDLKDLSTKENVNTLQYEIKHRLEAQGETFYGVQGVARPGERSNPPFRSLKDGKYRPTTDNSQLGVKGERPSGSQELSAIERDKSDLRADSTFGEQIGQIGEEFELGPSKTYYKNANMLGLKESIVKGSNKEDMVNGDEEEILDYEEVKRARRKDTLEQILQGFPSQEEEREKESKDKENNRRNVFKESVERIKRISENYLNFERNDVKSAGHSRMSSVVEKEMETGRGELVSEYEIEKIKAEMKEAEERRSRRERACIYLEERLKRKRLNVMYKCMVQMYNYCIEKANERVKKLGNMVKALDNGRMRAEYRQVQSAFDSIRNFVVEQEGEERDDFVVQLSKLVKVGDVLETKVLDLYREFWNRIYQITVQKNIFFAEKVLVGKLFRIISVNTNKVKSQAFSAIRSTQASSFENRKMRKQLAESLVDTTSRAVTKKELHQAFTEVKKLAEASSIMDNFVALLEERLAGFHFSMKRSFFSQFRLKSEVMKIKYPHLASSLEQKLNAYKRNLLASAFNNVRSFVRQRVQNEHTKRKQIHSLNYLEFVMSKLVYKTKREAFQKLAKVLDTPLMKGSPLEVNKISLAVVLLKIYTRFQKTNLDQIKEHGYVRIGQVKNSQMKRTALKNIVKTIRGKVSEYYREFINILKVDQKLYSSNKSSESVQMNYKVTILVHKLQALSKIKRTEAMNAFFSSLKQYLLRSPMHSARVDSRKLLSIEVEEEDNSRKSPIINRDAVLNTEFKSPNFKYLQERAAVGGEQSFEKNVWDQKGTYVEKVANTNMHEETNQSFGDLLRLSGENPLLRQSRGYKINFEEDEDFKEQLRAVHTQKFGFEEPEEEKRMGSGTKENFSIIENAGYDTNSDHFNWTQSAREDIHSQTYSPRVKGINLLRSYGLQFNNPLEDGDSQKKDQLMRKQNPKYIKEKAQLHNPNESLEILKTGREDSRFTEEYAEPLELEAKAQAPLLNSDPELHLSSINSSNLGTGQWLSIATSNFNSIVTPQNVPGIFSPSSSHSNAKDYVYTKLLPKPSNLKNPAIKIDKPQTGPKKSVTIHSGSLPPKKADKIKDNQLFTVDMLETNSNALRSKSNEKNFMAANKNKVPTKKSTPTGSQGSGSSPREAGAPMFKNTRPAKLSKENKPLELEVVSPRYDYFGAEGVMTNQSPLQVIENRPKKLNSRQSSQESLKSLKPPKSSSKKDLKIQIPYSPSGELLSPSGGSIGGGMMDKLEQRLLDGEKYGTLYELYKERNPEKAENIKSMMKGNVSGKIPTSRNYSPNGTFVSPK